MFTLPMIYQWAMVSTIVQKVHADMAANVQILSIYLKFSRNDMKSILLKNAQSYVKVKMRHLYSIN